MDSSIPYKYQTPIKSGPSTALDVQQLGHVNRWYHTSLPSSRQQKLALRTSAPKAPYQRMVDNNGVSTPTSDNSEAGDQQPARMILALIARKLQKSKDVRERGRGNAPSQHSPQRITLTEKSTTDVAAHLPPPPPPPPLPRSLLVATTHAGESTSASITGPGDTLQ